MNEIKNTIWKAVLQDRHDTRFHRLGKHDIASLLSWSIPSLISDGLEYSDILQADKIFLGFFLGGGGVVVCSPVFKYVRRKVRVE